MTTAPGPASPKGQGFYPSPSRRLGATFYCSEDNTEDTAVMAWIEGAQVASTRTALSTRSLTRS